MTNETDTGRPVVRVEVYSDYTCPWCYIGTARLERLEEELAGEVELEVEWKPFEIHPEVPEQGLPASALGYPPAQWAMMVANLRRQAEAEGLTVGKLERMSNTHRALAASAYVQTEEPERFEAFHRALFRAYFGEGRDLSDRGVLRAIAGSAGVDVASMEQSLDGGRYEEVLRETTRSARERGVTGTPTFVFDGCFPVVGAQSADALRSVVERALAGRER